MQSELVISLFFSLFLFWLPLQKLIFPLDSKQKKDNELKDTLRSSWLWVKHYENIQKARSILFQTDKRMNLQTTFKAS